MVRITQYDPRISAEVYSHRRAAERPFDSPLAEGLGRLGRSLMVQEERGEPGNQDKTLALRAMAKMRKAELARMREDLKPGSADPRGSGKRFLKGHVKRRDAFLKALAERNPRSAGLVADRSRVLTEDVARRATVFEAANIGDALAADINAALTDAIDTVRADPTQREAAQGEFRATLSALAKDGVDGDVVATLIAAAERKIAHAAIDGREEEDPVAAREELAAGEFGDGLFAEEVELRLAKADREVKTRQRRAEAMAKSAEDAFVAEFRDYERRLSVGEAAGDEAFSEDGIRARVSPDVAERLIGQRDRAEARGSAFREIEFLSEEEIAERLEEANSDEIRHLLWARDHRRRLIGQGLASFVLRDPIVREAHERWLQARADGDEAASEAAGVAWANAARALQRRLGARRSDHRILTTEIAGGLVRETEHPDGLDAAALGAMLRDQFGEHWQVALADLERAGLSEQMAMIAALDRPAQQPAARQLSESVGTPTSELRDTAGDTALAIDHLLGITFGNVPQTTGLDGVGAEASRAELVRRRAYALAAEGLAPHRAVQRAFEDLSVANRSVTAGLDGLSLEVLAESQGIRPTELGEGGARVESILRRLTRFHDLSGDEHDTLKDDIRRLRGNHEGYAALHDRFVALETSAGLLATESEEEAVEHPTVPALELNYRHLIARNLEADPIARSNTFSSIGSALLVSERIGEENREWINAALTSGDPRRRDFAADYLAHVGGLTGFDIGDVLSEAGIETYLALALVRYEERDHPDVGRYRSSDTRLEALAEFATTEGGWGVPSRLASRLLIDINRSIDSTDEQREALIEFISQVVTPFNRVVGQRLQQAVVALGASAENVGEVPGRFAFLLSDDQLVEAAVARGMDRLNFNSEPLRPEGLDWLDHVIGGGGVALGVGGTLAATGPFSLVAGLLGLRGSTIGYGQALNDADEELNEYLINMELYYRFQGLRTRSRITDVENKIRDPADTRDLDLIDGEVDPNDPATMVLGGPTP